MRQRHAKKCLIVTFPFKQQCSTDNGWSFRRLWRYEMGTSWKNTSILGHCLFLSVQRNQVFRKGKKVENQKSEKFCFFLTTYSWKFPWVFQRLTCFFFFFANLVRKFTFLVHDLQVTTDRDVLSYAACRAPEVKACLVMLEGCFSVWPRRIYHFHFLLRMTSSAFKRLRTVEDFVFEEW